jgi:DNA-binding response OmpR family regulator
LLTKATPIRAQTIFLVEDEKELANEIKAELERLGYHVQTASIAQAADAARVGDAAILVMDRMVFGEDSLNTLEILRKESVKVPVLMISALSSIDERVRGLKAGGDDYLTKPFAFRELTARIRALARRQPVLQPAVVNVADLEVDLRGHRARRGGTTIDLTAKEFALLEFLALHRDEVVDRAAITAHVWDENHDPFTNVLEVLVRRLRRKIDDPYEPKLIHTMRGAGYRLGV